MKTCLYFIMLVMIFSSCRSKATRMVSSFSNQKDTVMKKLSAMPDSALTRIKIEPYVFMFDTVKKGSLVRGSFKVKNVGKQPFGFSQVISFCDCTTAKPEAKLIAAGDSSELTFILDTDSFQEGYNERAVTVLGNFKPYFRTLKIEGYIKE